MARLVVHVSVSSQRGVLNMDAIGSNYQPVVWAFLIANPKYYLSDICQRIFHIFGNRRITRN